MTEMDEIVKLWKAHLSHIQGANTLLDDLETCLNREIELRQLLYLAPEPSNLHGRFSRILFACFFTTS